MFEFLLQLQIYIRFLKQNGFVSGSTNKYTIVVTSVMFSGKIQ